MYIVTYLKDLMKLVCVWSSGNAQVFFDFAIGGSILAWFFSFHSKINQNREFKQRLSNLLEYFLFNLSCLFLSIRTFNINISLLTLFLLIYTNTFIAYCQCNEHN